MSAVAPVLFLLVTVVATEILAVVINRYVMHGFGWGWHRSHHEAHDELLEQNDLYAVFFAGFAIVLMAAGHWWAPLFWVSIGLVLYGVLYFMVHDGLVHQRWPFRVVPKNPYLKRLVQAHRLHHAVEGREDCVSFGFLYAPPVRRLRQELRARHGDRLRGDDRPRGGNGLKVEGS